MVENMTPREIEEMNQHIDQQEAVELEIQANRDQELPEDYRF